MNRHLKSLIIALLLALCVSTTTALRATPAQVIIPSDAEGAFSVRVLDVVQPSDLTVRVSGDLADYTVLNAPLQHPEGGVLITGALMIPADLSAGDHTQEIIIATAPQAGEGTVNARTEIAIPLIVRVPYPDAYLTASWNIQPDAGSSMSHILVTLENRGRVPVTPERISLAFADGDTILPSLDLDTDMILPSAFLRREASYAPPADLTPGIYTATLRVPYAQSVLEQSSEVAIGAPRIALSHLAYDLVERGSIVPVDVAGTIAWNRPVPVTLTVWLDDAVIPATSAAVDAEGSFDERLYIDTGRSGVPVHSVRVTVVAGDAVASRTQLLPANRAQEPAGVSLWWFVALAGILLLLVIFLLWRRVARPPTQSTESPQPPAPKESSP